MHAPSTPAPSPCLPACPARPPRASLCGAHDRTGQGSTGGRMRHPSILGLRSPPSLPAANQTTGSVRPSIHPSTRPHAFPSVRPFSWGRWEPVLSDPVCRWHASHATSCHAPALSLSLACQPVPVPSCCGLRRASLTARRDYRGGRCDVMCPLSSTAVTEGDGDSPAGRPSCV